MAALCPRYSEQPDPSRGAGYLKRRTRLKCSTRIQQHADEKREVRELFFVTHMDFPKVKNQNVNRMFELSRDTKATTASGSRCDIHYSMVSPWVHHKILVKLLESRPNSTPATSDILKKLVVAIRAVFVGRRHGLIETKEFVDKRGRDFASTDGAPHCTDLLEKRFPCVFIMCKCLTQSCHRLQEG